MNVNIKVIEIGGIILILAIFIASFALVGSVPELKPWSNILYVVMFLVFTVVVSLFGLKLAPYLND